MPLHDRIKANPVLDALLLLLAQQISSNMDDMIADGATAETALTFATGHVANVIHDELGAVLAELTGLTVESCDEDIHLHFPN